MFFFFLFKHHKIGYKYFVECNSPSEQQRQKMSSGRSLRDQGAILVHWPQQMHHQYGSSAPGPYVYDWRLWPEGIAMVELSARIMLPFSLLCLRLHLPLGMGHGPHASGVSSFFISCRKALATWFSICLSFQTRLHRAQSLIDRGPSATPRRTSFGTMTAFGKSYWRWYFTILVYKSSAKWSIHCNGCCLWIWNSWVSTWP